MMAWRIDPSPPRNAPDEVFPICRSSVMMTLGLEVLVLAREYCMGAAISRTASTLWKQAGKNSHEVYFRMAQLLHCMPSPNWHYYNDRVSCIPS